MVAAGVAAGWVEGVVVEDLADISIGTMDTSKKPEPKRMMPTRTKNRGTSTRVTRAHIIKTLPSFLGLG